MTQAGERSLGAEADVRAKLARLSRLRASCGNGDEDVTQGEADRLLARVAWSRLAEPGDSAAGALVRALGVEEALRLLVEGVSPQRILEAALVGGAALTPRVVSDALERWRPRLDRTATIGDIDRALHAKLGLVEPESWWWPPGFDDLGDHAPLTLWTRGDAAHLREPSLSVVGARAATGYGTHITAEIVDGVCQAGVTIVSGAAYGIDAVAHRTALAADVATVAVLAGGADRVYPAAHDSLLERIGRTGLVCAEMIPGSAPTRWRFRARNRLIAALSSATLVTEAGVRSGTLNTAGHAATLGRALGAVPGPVTSAASSGCHVLIREYGAALVTNSRDACELLGLDDRLDLGGLRADARGGRMPPTHERVLDALPLRGGLALSELARTAGLSEAEAHGALAELELLGAVRQAVGKGGAEPSWSIVRAR